MGSIPYDRDNPEHPRLRDVWGHTYANRAVRVEIVGTAPGSPDVTFRYCRSRGRKRIDLARFLAEWSLLSRWPGLEGRTRSSTK